MRAEPVKQTKSQAPVGRKALQIDSVLSARSEVAWGKDVRPRQSRAESEQI
jgi:hypothetical protein